MAIYLDRLNGQNYAENIVNPALSFNEGTWTVASGTGTASLVDTSPLEGVKHLKLQNNTVGTPLVVGNSSQTTIIPFTGTYQLSLFLRKFDPLSIRTLSVLVYQNAALLDTQVCVLGSVVAEEDKNGIWVRFQSDTTYSFTANDEITFQFSFAGTGAVAEQIEIDALMLNQGSRGNSIVPAYNRPIASPIVTGTGWAQYIDTTYTVGSPLAIAEGVTATFTNNANTVIKRQIPIGVDKFFDTSTQKIVPAREDDAYNISLRFKAKASVLNAYFDVILDIGGGLGIISQETCIFTRAANTEQRFDVDLTVFTADTFVANGGALTINAISGDLEIYDINFLIVRIHAAR